MRGHRVLLYVYRGARPEEAPWQSENCGTYAGWNEHQRNHEPACDRCKRAQADYMREWRLRTGRVRTIRVRPTEAQLALLNRHQTFSRAN
jgi:hypothetical protein